MILCGLGIMIDEAVGQGHGAEAHAVQQAGSGQMGHDKACESANRSFLDRDQHGVVARELLDQCGVDRLGEAGVGHGGGQALGCQHVGGLQRIGQPRPKRQDGDAALFRPGLAGHFAHDSPTPDFKDLAGFRQFQPKPRATRVTQAKRAFVKCDGGRGHVLQFQLGAGCHQRDARQAAKVGDVERTRMRRTIGPHQPRAVDGEAHRQLLQHHVMHHLVIGALQEGGIDGAERAQPLGRHAGGKRHGMLFGNAHVKEAVGIEPGELVQPRARGHGGGNRDDPVVGRGLTDQLLRKDRGVAGRAGRALLLLTGHDIEFRDRVILVTRRFGRAVAMALFGNHMQQHGADILGVAQVAQDVDQLVHVMAVNGADVIEAQFLEQRAAGHDAARVFIRLLRRAFQAAGQALGHLGGEFA
ncbi:hypothetical protein MSKU15_3554 [Komagataeibacter diospyri]|nr:hypothetical protein MSKU15_3554 [Komagataeibacter diospyri]